METGEDSSGVARVRLCLLGGFRAERAGEPVLDSAWGRPQAKTLVKILAVERSHQLHREQLIELLWPDEQPATVDVSLRKLLSFARHALDAESGIPTLLAVRDELVTLDAQRIWIDADAFERAAKGALAAPTVEGLEAAASMYAGELLPEDRYEDWAAPRREDLSALHREVLLTLASMLTARGDRDGAGARLQQLLVLGPADEPVHRELMRLYAAGGNRAASLQQYRACREALAAELGVEPDEETASLARRIEAGETLAAPALPAAAQARWRTALVGRSRALELLLDHAALRTERGRSDAPGERPGVVLVRGEAGVGKTRLASETAQEAGRRGATVLWGTCYRPIAFAPFAEALEQYVAGLPRGQRRRLAQAHPELALILPSLELPEPIVAGDVGGDQLRLFAAVARFLIQLSADRPVLLVLDDLHLADDASLQLLVYLSRLAARRNWLILGTYREEDVARGSDLDSVEVELRRSGRSRQLELMPLGRRECDRLVELLVGGGVSEEVQAHLFESTVGNPLFVVELVGTLHDQGRLVRANEGTWTLTPGARNAVSIPGQVSELIAGRVGSLDESTRQLLALAAVIGMDASRAVLGRAAARAGLEPTEAVRSIEYAAEARVLVEREGSHAFSHPLYRELIYRALSGARREYLHGTVARAIEEVDARDVESLAHHYVRTQEQEKAIVYLERAGDRAHSVYANALAEQHYRDLSARLESVDRPGDLARAKEKLGSVLTDASRYNEALPVFAVAMGLYADLGDADGTARAAAATAFAHLNGGTIDEGIAVTEQTLAAVKPRATPLALSLLTLRLAALHQAWGSYQAALEDGGRALEMARTTEGSEAEALVARAQTLRGWSLVMLGKLIEARDELRLAVAGAEAVGDLQALSSALPNLAGATSNLGDFEEARRCMEQATAIAERLGNEAWAAFCAAGAGGLCFFLGDWKNATLLIEGALARLRALGEPAYATTWALAWRAYLAIGEGRLDLARRMAEEAVAVAERTGVLQHLRLNCILLAYVDLSEGEAARALARLEPLLPAEWERDPANGQAGAVDLDSNLVLAFAGWAYQQLGDFERADRASSLAVDRARASGSPRYLQDVLETRASVLIGQRRYDEAEDALAEALGLVRRMRAYWVESVILELRARLEAARGDLPGSVELLRQAAAIFTRMGADHAAARLHAQIIGTQEL